jgi:2-succinyl-5-enolpyruvyl-6-hydroxy-3-cyclohexene-1-carboxylate synthase
VSFSYAANAFGLEHQRIDGAEQFSATLQTAIQQQKKIIIEAIVPPLQGMQDRQTLWSNISAAIRGVF